MEAKKEKIDKIIAEKCNVSLDEITPESTFEDLGCDSLDRVELIMELETEFNTAIADVDAEKINTVNDVYEYLKDK